MPDTIFDDDPRDWRGLQNMVARLFTELGCAVEIGKKVGLVRGFKEIDVDVRDPTSTPSSRYLCECKFWSKAVPQEVVHSFRTVVADCGAHRGFIISRTGFQSGAREAARNTNLELLTFNELQTIYFRRWRTAMGKKYLPDADRLFPYWDPSGGRMPKIKWTDRHREHHRRLMDTYRPLIDLGPVSELNDFVWRLPITVPTINQTGDVTGMLTLATYRQLYDFIEKNKDLALRQFRHLHGEV
jgi:hypothetical protein